MATDGDAIHRGVFEVAVDGSGVTAGVEQAKAEFKNLEAAAAQTGAAVAGALDGGVTSGKLDATTARMIAGLKREAEQAGLTRAQIYELKLARAEAANPGITAANAQFIQTLKDAEAAQRAAAQAAKDEAAAQREAAQAKRDADRARSSNDAFEKNLQLRAASVGKSAAETLEAEAAQRGLTASTAVYIQKLKEAEAAQLRSAQAARDEAAAQKEAARAKASNDAFVKNVQLKSDTAGKTAAETLEAEAAQRGLTGATAQYIQKLKEEEAAQRLAAAAAREAAQAQRDAARQKASNEAFARNVQFKAGTIGKSAAEALEFEAAQRGMTKELAASIAALKAGEQRFNAYGLSAKQNVAALRQVPAQLTDIIVGLQGGQAPLTVLLQQGGQLRDVFGGAVPALKAVGAAALNLINPFTIAAGAVAALIFGYARGAAEGDTFARSLILTGNAAGTSVGQLTDMASAIDQVAGTQANAAEALAAFAATGQVGAQNIEAFTLAAIKLERAGGPAVTETVRKFEELGKSPVEASRKLNEAERYLTLSVYEQIKALAEQGKAIEAANLAQNAYADAINNRTPAIVERLGYIERAWKGIKDGIAEAADSLLAFGRTQGPATQVAALERQIELANSKRGPNTDNKVIDAQVAAFQRQIDNIQRTEDATRKQAAAQKEAADATKEGIAAEEKVSKIRSESASNQEKLNKALKEYRASIEQIRRANPESKLLDPKQIARDEANIRERFKDKKGPKTPKAIDDDKAELEAALAANKRFFDEQLNAFRNAETLLEAERSAGLINEAEYYEAKREFIRKNQDAQDNAAIGQIAALEVENESLRIKRDSAKADNDRVRISREIIDNERKIADAEEKRVTTAATATTQIEVLNIRQKASQDALTRSFVESQKAAEAYLRTFQNRQDRAVEAVGQGDVRRGFNSGLNDIEDRFTERRQQLERERRTGLYRDNEAGYKRELDLLQKTKDAEVGIYLKGFDEIQKAQENYANGANRALENYLETVRNVAQQTEGLLGNAFRGLEDVLTDFVATGKADFKSLGESIVKDLARIQVKQFTGGLAELAQGSVQQGGVFGQLLGLLIPGKGGDGSTKTPTDGVLRLNSSATSASSALDGFATKLAQFQPGTVSAQPSEERDALRRTEAAYEEAAQDVGGLSNSIVNCMPELDKFGGVFGPLGGTLGGFGRDTTAAGVALRLLPLIIQGFARSRLTDLFSAFDTSGIGIGSEQPSVERDALRRIEASVPTDAFDGVLNGLLPGITSGATASANTISAAVASEGANSASSIVTAINTGTERIVQAIGGIGFSQAPATPTEQAFSVFDTSAAGTTSTPSAERDTLRQIEASIPDNAFEGVLNGLIPGIAGSLTTTASTIASAVTAEGSASSAAIASAVSAEGASSSSAISYAINLGTQAVISAINAMSVGDAPDLSKLFGSFDTTGRGVGDEEPTAARDLLRQMEASVGGASSDVADFGSSLAASGERVTDVLGAMAPVIRGMGGEAASAASALKLLPLIIESIQSSSSGGGFGGITDFFSGLFGGSSGGGFFNDAGGYELAGSLGFHGGGYTGPGGKYEAAGVVHKDEVVWSKDDVRRWGGPARVDAMRRGEGYADGGIGGFMPRNSSNTRMVAPTNNVIINEAPQGSKVERRRNNTGGEDFIVTFKKQVKDEVKGEMASEVMNGEGLLGPISQRTGVSRSAGLIV
jgi:lambda family phage tail tape measure protein